MHKILSAACNPGFANVGLHQRTCGPLSRSALVMPWPLPQNGQMPLSIWVLHWELRLLPCKLSLAVLKLGLLPSWLTAQPLAVQAKDLESKASISRFRAARGHCAKRILPLSPRIKAFYQPFTLGTQGQTKL